MSLSRNQHGVTLVELMIAMVIGMLIIAGVSQIFLSSRASNKLQERMSTLQENGQFALIVLQRSLRKAGFPKSAALNPFTDTPTDMTCPITVSVANCASANVGTCNGAGNASDQVAVCYQGAKDCLGQAVASGVVTDFFFVNRDVTTGVSRLMCRGIGSAQARPLVDGIENLQVQYGQDTDGDFYANNYVRANEVTNWDNVVSVRVSVLATTKSNDTAASGIAGTLIGNTASDAHAYQVLEMNLPASSVATGVHARIFTSTLELRNRTP